MPPKSKIIGKGGKSHRRAKNGASAEAQVKELVLKAEGQVYGKVTKMLGNGRVHCRAFMDSGEKLIMCIIPGKFRKRLWINMEDLVLIGIRDYQEDKADILYKYSPLEAKRLIRLGEVPASEDVGEGDNNEINDNIQWITEKEVKDPNPNSQKKSTSGYMDPSFLPPGSDDEYETDSQENETENVPVEQKITIEDVIRDGIEIDLDDI